MRTGQVFISHTSDMASFPENRSFVQAVLDAVGRAGMASVDMRYFAARDGKPADYCRQRVSGCEIYVAVVGFRYGSTAPGEAVSYTELEFEEAAAAGLPRLVFLLDAAAGMPTELADADRGLVEGFRQRLRDAGLVVRDFTSGASLELEVFHALTYLAASASPTVPAPPGLAVRYSLPPDTAAFTGRDEELARIAATVTAAAVADGVVAVHAIDGMPGVGKTALAVHVAHQLRWRFPDGQLFVDLRAHTPGQDPALPAAALAGLLTAAGTEARYLPGDLEDLAALWRDRMAGQRALLVLDNAASSAQVTPLLPGDAGCLVLVTSRRHLGDLPGPVVPVLLDALPPDQAQAMFLRLAPRAAADPAAAVQELVGLAGHLPLAISLLARVYTRHPVWTLADLARETRARLLTLAAEKDSVAVAFEVSYQYLPPGQQEFFRCLGLHPGTTIDGYAAAALAGISLPDADCQLDALHGEGLLTEAGYRRYGMHDLIGRYARDLAATDLTGHRDQRLGRLLDYYQHTAAAADVLLGRQSRTMASPIGMRPPAAVPDLPDRTQALSWARVERVNLLACLDHATRTGQHSRIAALTAAIASLLRQDGPWADAIIRHVTAVEAARHLGDQPGQANALNDLGSVRYMNGDYRAAAEDLEEAVGISRDLGDRLTQANALNYLGMVLQQTGDYPAAIEAQEEALGISRDLSDRLGQARALSDLGGARYLTGNFPAAAEALEEALGISRDLGDRLAQARALNYLGMVRQRTGDYPGAAEAQEEALGISRDLGDRTGQANAINHLGVVRRQTGDYPGATEALEEALGIYRDFGDRLGEASALNDLGIVRQLTGDYPAAAGALEESLGICRDLGDRGAEAELLNSVGALYRLRGDMNRAEACHQQGLYLAREIGASLDEACALAGLGRCALATGRITSAEASLLQAQEIFQRIGAAEAVGVAAELDALTSAGSTAKGSDVLQ
jgi:tetratricopeptide (TPR) repeat protein